MRIKTLYFADSLGSLKPSLTSKKYLLSKNHGMEKLEFVHDNMGKALIILWRQLNMDELG